MAQKERVVTHIEQRLRKAMPIEEESYRRLFRLISREMDHADTQCATSLAEFEQDVAARYTYGDAAELEGFDIGALWGALEVYKARLDEIEEQRIQEVRIKLVREHVDIFRAIDRMQGAAQGEIARELGYKKSNFSQILSRMDGFNIYSVAIAGRTKHLYLTQLGKRALQSVLRELEDGSTQNANGRWRKDVVVAGSFVYDSQGRLEDGSMSFLYARVSKASERCPTNANHDVLECPSGFVPYSQGTMRNARSAPIQIGQQLGLTR